MQRTMFFKKFLMPCGLCAAVPTMKPANPPEEHAAPCHNEAQPKKLIKPSELPIYSVEEGYSKQMPCAEYPSVVEENIRKVRQTVQGIKVIYDGLSNSFSTGLEHFKFAVDYIQDENNFMSRAGAVGMGGVTGFVLSLRGGFFKRLLYTSVGAGIVGSVCFPKETKEAFNMVEYYGNIGYNFIYGVKPGENTQKISLKHFSLMKSLRESEFFQIISKPFGQKSNTATDKKEENPAENKTETKEK